jgi:phytoene dehydrogenase-like protein
MPSSRDSIIIIGAGIAGLSAGCYAQMNGYRSRIMEMHDRPGGVCTSWSRNGYTFDHSLIHLTGTGPSSRARAVWDELGALRDTKIIAHRELARVITPDGMEFDVRSDLDAFIDEMRQWAPGDASVIEKYGGAIRGLSGLEPLTMPIGGWKDRTKGLALMKWNGVTIGDFARRFQDPLLRQVFSVMQNGDPDTPMLVHLAYMRMLCDGELGWPEGGSQKFTSNIEERYSELGGEVLYGKKVVRIPLYDKRAVGVQTDDGIYRRANLVISAADGRNTIFGLFGGNYVRDEVRAYYEAGYPQSQEFGLQIALGVRRDLTGEPHFIVQLLDEPVTIEGTSRDRLNLQLYSSETGLAPEGKGIIKVALSSSYDHWRGLLADRDRYEAEKERIAATAIALLERYFPGLSEQVEVVDISTGATSERFTGNYRGLRPWPPSGGLSRPLRGGRGRALPGISNFYMVGRWAMGLDGLNPAAISGREVVRRICGEDRKVFTPSVE